jgi:hypothetical protein
MRFCYRCNKEKEEKEFWSGCSYCISCDKEYRKIWRQKNKEKYSTRRSELWRKNNPRYCKNCENQINGTKYQYCCSHCNFINQIIKQENGCWEWQGLKNHSKYGYFTDFETRKKIFSHRYSYKTFRGEITENFHVCHTCDNPKCCNPAHLFLGTDKDNMQDCKNKGRTAKGDKVARKGEDNKNSIFTEELVFQIRKMCSEGLKDREISNRLGSDKYSIYQINAIRHRRSWKHIH